MNAEQPAENPVTASLLSRLEDEPLHRFVATWDELEQLAVAAHRDRQHDGVQETRYRKLLVRLLEDYPRWENELGQALESLLPPSMGEEEDPFSRILSAASLDVLQADWDLVRCFPQAREAINVYLLERLTPGGQGGA